MKLKITPENIVFDYFFYSFIIPKNSSINYSFPMEMTEDYGVSPRMIILSKDEEIKYNFYFIGWIFYHAELVLNMLFYLYNPFLALSMRSLYKNQHTTVGVNNLASRKSALEKIEQVLKILKENGYEITIVENEFKKIVETGINKNQQEGTTQWKKDKFWGFITILLLFIGFSGYIYYKGYLDFSDKFILVPIFVVGIIIFIGLITIFAKTKNFLYKLLFTILFTVILISILDNVF